MDVSTLSNAGLQALVQSLGTLQQQGQVQTQMVRLANDQIRQQGAAVLELIEAVPQSAQGSRIDLMA